MNFKGNSLPSGSSGHRHLKQWLLRFQSKDGSVRCDHVLQPRKTNLLHSPHSSLTHCRSPGWPSGIACLEEPVRSFAPESAGLLLVVHHCCSRRGVQAPGSCESHQSMSRGDQVTDSLWLNAVCVVGRVRDTASLANYRRLGQSVPAPLSDNQTLAHFGQPAGLVRLGIELECEPPRSPPIGPGSSGSSTDWRPFQPGLVGSHCG